MRKFPFLNFNDFVNKKTRENDAMTIPILFNLFQPSIDCSLVNTKFLEVFECIFFAFVHMKLIKVGNYSFEWLFTIAVHDENDRNIFMSFFLQNRKKNGHGNFCVLWHNS